MNTFNEGDRVQHSVHGFAEVVRVSTGKKLVEIAPFGYGGSTVVVHPVSLTLVPHEPKFKTGDRVFHAQHGTATVLDYDAAIKLVEIEPDRVGTATVYVHPVSLTDVGPTPKFKIGDRVSHPLHRDGTVASYSAHSGLYTIDLPGNRGYYALEDQITHAKPEPKFTVLYRFTHGNSAKSTMIPMNRQQTEAYLTNLSDWDTVESITITRAKG